MTTASALELPPEFARFFNIEGVHDDSEGLRVLVRGLGVGDPVWRVAFPMWDAYRVVANESDALVFGPIAKRAGSGALRVNGSAWAKEFAAQGSGWAASVEFLHLVLAGANSVFEVLARAQPEFTLLTGREANV